jgi:glycerol-3-phosphate dehydrogenase subunit C
LTPVFDPFHPRYFDEADLRDEMVRVHDVCGGCRACVGLCDSFPRLFELLDRTVGGAGGGAGSLTAAEQDVVVDGCFDCGLCVLGCPEAPGRSELMVDVGRLNARARQVRWLTETPSISSRAVGGVRRAWSSIAGPRQRMRFTTWMTRRSISWTTGSVGSTTGNGVGPPTRAAIFPTCQVEHHDPALGRAVVAVIERTGAPCALPSGLVCCGAPQLAAGDVESFVELGRRNVRVLADSIRAGHEVVVPLPRCAAILRSEYSAHVGGADAELVAEHTHDVAAYLRDRHRSGETDLSAYVVDAPVDTAVSLHVACSVRSRSSDVPAAEMLGLVGFEVTVVEGCASPDPRAPERIRIRTRSALDASDAAGPIGECPHALGVVAPGSGSVGHHPVQLLAATWGLETD